MQRDECVICMDRLTVFAIGQCGHDCTCYNCSFRSRVLYGDKKCPVCRENNETILYTKKKGNFNELMKGTKIFHFKQYGIVTNDRDVYKYLKYLLSATCKFCSEEFKSSSELNEHYKVNHHVSFCPICLKSQKAFLCDMQLYTEEELIEHYNEVNPETQVKKHPACEFCSINFYDLDALYNHLNNEHETCFICDKHSDQPGVEYYRDYDELYAHMKDNNIIVVIILIV
ncbi:RING-type E3 ubiquitin transferase [Entamoeba marina]